MHFTFFQLVFIPFGRDDMFSFFISSSEGGFHDICSLISALFRFYEVISAKSTSRKYTLYIFYVSGWGKFVIKNKHFYFSKYSKAQIIENLCETKPFFLYNGMLWLNACFLGKAEMFFSGIIPRDDILKTLG